VPGGEAGLADAIAVAAAAVVQLLLHRLT